MLTMDDKNKFTEHYKKLDILLLSTIRDTIKTNPKAAIQIIDMLIERIKGEENRNNDCK
jgi:hypothetical protein